MIILSKASDCRKISAPVILKNLADHGIDAEMAGVSPVINITMADTNSDPGIAAGGARGH